MGITPKKDGTEIVDCAIERPCVSIRTTAKSLDSRVTVEKDVRCNAVPASSTMANNRDHKILKLIPSKVLGLMMHPYPQQCSFVYPQKIDYLDQSQMWIPFLR